MSDFIQLKCTNCGGELTENSQDGSYSCKMCGAKYVLKFEQGGIQIERILDAKLKGVQAGVNVLASEMAIQRLREDIRKQSQKITNLENAHQRISIPREPQYNLVNPLLVFLICTVIAVAVLYPSITYNASHSINDVGLWVVSILVFAGLWQFGLKTFRIYQVRDDYMSESRERLISEIANPPNDVSIGDLKREAKSQLQALKKEAAEKQKELDWHLKNVKLKRK